MSKLSLRDRIREEMDAVEAEFRAMDPPEIGSDDEFGQPMHFRWIQVPVRFDLADLHMVRAAAKANGLRESEFIRQAAVNVARANESPLPIDTAISATPRVAEQTALPRPAAIIQYRRRAEQLKDAAPSPSDQTPLRRVAGK